MKLSPHLILCVMMCVFAVFEFFPANYSITSLWFFGMCVVGVSWVLIFPQTKLISKHNAESLFFLVFWLIYSLISYLWAVDKSPALEYSYFIARYTVTYMMFELFLRKNPRVLAKAHVFLMAIVGLYYLTAVWEVVSFNHLPSSRLYESGIPIPTGPFYNENNLAALLLLLFPIMLFFARMVPNLWGKIASIASVLLFMIITTIQGARIAMLISGGVLAVFFLFWMKAKYKIISVVAVVLGLILVARVFPLQTEIASGLLEHELGSLRSETETVKMSSVKIRKHLIGEVFELSAESGFMGLGGGNVEHYMDTDRTHRTAGIINAHNWLLELLGNFGVIPLMLFGYLMLRWLYLLWHRYKAAQGVQKTVYMSFIWVLILFVPASILPSSIRWYNSFWIVFAIINALSHTPIETLKEYI